MASSTPTVAEGHLLERSLRVEGLSQDRPGRASVLICDEQPVSARGLARLIETELPRSGLFVASVATDCRDATSTSKTMSPDVAVVSASVPGHLGSVCAREIKRTSPATRTILMFTHIDRRLVHEAIDDGVQGFISRTADVSEIANTISLVLADYTVMPTGLVDDIRTALGRLDTPDLDPSDEQILSAIAHGLTYRQIGKRMHLSERTVRRRVSALFTKHSLTDRTEAAVFAAHLGLI